MWLQVLSLCTMEYPSGKASLTDDAPNWISLTHGKSGLRLRTGLYTDSASSDTVHAANGASHSTP
jgi:hypothetical protein